HVITAAAILATTSGAAVPQPRPLVIAATTSVEDSGLFKHLVPAFAARSGLNLRILSRASALALLTAERGEVDLVIVNDAAALDRFVAAHPGSRRQKLMHNRFVIAGPAADP